MSITNATIICEQITNKTIEGGLKVVGEAYLPSFLIFWVGTLLLILIIGLATIKKDFAKFFAIFIIPLLLGLLILIFTFVIPLIPKFTGNWMSGLLG